MRLCILIALTPLLLYGCSTVFDLTLIDKAEKLCAHNEGIYRIRVYSASDKIVCNNGATFYGKFNDVK